MTASVPSAVNRGRSLASIQTSLQGLLVLECQATGFFFAHPRAFGKQALQFDGGEFLSQKGQEAGARALRLTE